ncbi:hypothetical protein T459_08903 [Capsicum annuum]|uniref:G-patch domain-containing protein n=1 Tax=Capsicum annuum TaxID=4072 RepID=A0A2G2ZXT1_CAPAN|nr:hypothetical protein T459_08903 [Capsicum annuum]
MLFAAKIIASEILKYGYQPKMGLGPKVDATIEPIQLKYQRGTTGLRYKPTSGGVCSEGSGVIVFVPTQVPVLEQAGDEDIIEGIKNLFIVVIEREPQMDFKKLTIRDAEPGEVLQNWTINPSLFQQESS